MCSKIIEHVKAACDRMPDSALACFYFDFNDIEKQKVSPLVSSLIVQLCNQVVKIPEELDKIFEKCQVGDHEASSQELEIILFSLVKAFGSMFIVFDALDECPKDGEREDLLDLLAKIKICSPSNVHVLVTSRPEVDIKDALQDLTTYPVISIQGSEVAADIRKHFSNELSKHKHLRK
ncbi:MAG: hypothetical protein MMC33_002880 [Icmadophila ericetorum]|nr:hypothetical protein [Icmadophila ericetorum]